MKTLPYVEPTNGLLDFAKFLQYSKIFIETGTCLGRSVSAALAAGYERVKSVEAKKEYYEHCKLLFANKPVDLFHGKSIDHLPEMLKDITGPVVLWLDAHVSGEASAGYTDYIANGIKSDYHQHTAIIKELSIVLAHRKDHVILIDDQNGPNADNEVYLKMISTANPAYKFYWLDEQSGEIFYKDKILLAVIPH